MKKLKSLISVFLVLAILSIGFACSKRNPQKESQEEILFTYSGNTITGLTSEGEKRRILTIPSEIDGVKITRVGSSSFSENTALQEVVISDGITFIGENAFYDCSSLTKVTMPSTLEIIDDNAFSFCMLLKEISLPKTISLIDENAFEFCESLEKIIYDGSYEEWQLIDIHHDWSLNSSLRVLICDGEEYSMTY